LTKRKNLSRLAKARIFDRWRGLCVVCGLMIRPERGDRFEIHHIKALWAGGPDVESNMGPAHLDPCHRQLSANDNTTRAKTDRIRANHLGISKLGKKLPGGKDSPFKLTMRRGVVARFTQIDEHLRVMREREVK